jgi:hypothetical protein
VSAFDPATIADARLRRLHDYWTAKRGARRMPSRDDIDPVDFAYILGQVTLVDVHENPRRYRWRLVGTWWLEKFGVEGTGMWADEWPFPDQRAAVLRAYDLVASAGHPLVFDRSVWLDGRLLVVETLFLPLSENGEDVSMIVVALVEKP